MSQRLDELFIHHINTRPRAPYRFEVGQTVRIRSTLTVNVHAVVELLGRVGTVESRSRSMISDTRYYNVRVGDRVEPWEEDELDMRYAPAPEAPDA
jgi:hypothetical protein